MTERQSSSRENRGDYSADAAPTVNMRMRMFAITIETEQLIMEEVLPAAAAELDMQSLELISVIGFGGRHFLLLHENEIYPLLCRKDSWRASIPPRWAAHHLPSRLHCDCRRC